MGGVFAVAAISRLPTFNASIIGGPTWNSTHSTSTPRLLKDRSRSPCAFTMARLNTPFCQPTRIFLASCALALALNTRTAAAAKKTATLLDLLNITVSFCFRIFNVYVLFPAHGTYHSPIFIPLNRLCSNHVSTNSSGTVVWVLRARNQLTNSCE